MSCSPGCQSHWNFPFLPFEAVLQNHVLCLGSAQSRCVRVSLSEGWPQLVTLLLKETGVLLSQTEAQRLIPSPASLPRQLSGPRLLGTCTLAECRRTFRPPVGFLWGTDCCRCCPSGAVDCTSLILLNTS